MKEIIIGGKPLPIHFGLLAINEFIRQQNGDFEQMITSTNALSTLDSIVELTTTGLNEGARKAKSEIRYTAENVWDMFEEEPQLIIEVSELFIEAVVPMTEKLGTLVNPKQKPTATKKRRR